MLDERKESDIVIFHSRPFFHFLVLSVRGHDVDSVILGALSMVIASVPVALPMVMQITMAIGARKMADHKAIVTHLTALQEIASMTVLCSDKTGTLTTAHITVMPDQIWCNPESGLTKDEVLILAALCSNRANVDDAIDSALFRALSKRFGEAWEERMQEYEVTKFVGFNPEFKRTVCYANRTATSGGTASALRIGKGLVDKVLQTGSDGGDTWTVDKVQETRSIVSTIDTEMSTRGYKTIGVVVSTDGGPMKMVGIIPMLDPPREDTTWVIDKMHEAGVEVKMVTGDHLNIAKETAKLIGMSTNILPNTELWPASAMRDEMIAMAGGFAQVMPKDKQEVVAVLQKQGKIVGMTGDGVNDAPALKQAQIGIAVHGATDAARGASDIILTEPGLTPIYTAVVESRRIYQRLRSYVLYRLSATVQIVTLLSILIFGYDQSISAIYIILLALLNDITMIMVAYDNVKPSRYPEKPTVVGLLSLSVFLGLMMMLFSYMYYAVASAISTGDFASDDDYRESVIYVQISLSIEMLIFNCREPQEWFWSSKPCLGLTLSVIGANLLVIIFAATGTVIAQLSAPDIIVLCVYDVGVLFAVDVSKMAYQHWLKVNGFGSYLDHIGKDESGSKVGVGGSYICSLICELSRFLLCLGEGTDENGNPIRRQRPRKEYLREESEHSSESMTLLSSSSDDGVELGSPGDTAEGASSSILENYS
jgi:H+-transporting ATPase